MQGDIAPETTSSFFTYLHQQDSRLAYQVAGAPSGKPVFINYGLLGTVELPSDMIQQAVEANVKLIILSRPGYGSSDFFPMTSYLDWGDVVEAFLSYLGVDHFDVIGISAGAPYAYALAHRFPERVTGDVYILSGLPTVTDKDVFAACAEKDQAFYRQFWDADLPQIAEAMRQFIGKYRSWFYRLLLGKSWIRLVDIGLASEAIGLAQTIKLQMSDWGFDAYALPQTVHCWHARKDNEIAFAAVETMVRKMAKAELHIQKKNDHMPSQQTMNEVFALIQRTGS